MSKRKASSITSSSSSIKTLESNGVDIMGLIKGFTKAHWGLTLAYLGLIIFTTTLNVVLISKLTARFQKNIADADVHTGYKSLLFMMVILMLSFVFGYVTDVLENRMFPMFQAYAESKMLSLILEKNEANPELDVDANVYRQIMLRTSSSASHVYQQLLYTIIPNSIVLIVMFSFLFKLNWRYGLVFLGVAAVVSVIALGAKDRVMEKAKCQETMSKDAEWRAFDILFNMQLVVSKNMISTESQDMTQRLGVVCDDKIKYLQMVDNLGYLIQVTSYVGVFVVFWLALSMFSKALSKGMTKVAKDKRSKNVLTLIGVLMGVRMRLQNLTKSQIATVDSVGKYGHVAKKIKAISQREVAQGKETAPASTKANVAALDFRNVHFHYGKKHVLRGVSLRVKSAETVVVKGQSGSGKSTLAKACLRIVEPETGEVRVGNHRVQDYTLASLKQVVSFVNPDQGVLNRTILENIMYGCPKAHYDAKKKEAEDLWAQFKGVFDGKQITSQAGVGGGVELSTGQKQLVRLMNLLVCGNNQIIIMDEPTTGLDANTKKHVLTMIDTLRKSRTRTLLIITHDEECAKVGDRVVTMQDGQIS